MAKYNGGDTTKVKKVAIVEVKPLSKKVPSDATVFQQARIAKENAKHAEEFIGQQRQAYEKSLEDRMAKKMNPKK